MKQIKVRFIEKQDRCIVEMRLWPFWWYWFTARNKSEAEELIEAYNRMVIDNPGLLKTHDGYPQRSTISYGASKKE